MSAAAPKSKVQRMHLSVDGEGLTRVLRGLFEEGRAGHAVRTTMSAMMGSTTEQAFALLTGKKKLVNVPDSDGVELVDDDTEVSTFAYGDEPERPAPVDLDTLLRRLDWFESRRGVVDLCNDAGAIIHAANGTRYCVDKSIGNPNGQLVGSPAGLITATMAIEWLAQHVPYNEESWDRFWGHEEHVDEMRNIKQERDELLGLERPSPKVPEKKSAASEALAQVDPVKRMELQEHTEAAVESFERRRSIFEYACYLEISSFVDTGSIGAEHYYGHLKFRQYEQVDKGGNVQLTHPLSAREAKHLNKKDETSLFGSIGSKHRPGEQSYRFETKEEIRTVALAQYRQHFPKAEGLVEGRAVTVGPQPILHGYDDVAVRVNELAAEMEAIGWYDRNTARANEIDNEWTQLTRKPQTKTS